MSPLSHTDLRIGHSGRHVIALTGIDKGRYPHGTSVLVTGSEETVLIDPSLSVSQRGGVPADRVDRMLVSHAHEDHMAGCHHFPNAALMAHTEDVSALHSLRGFLDVYGMEPHIETQWAEQLVNDFHYAPRTDASAFVDGQTFDLGGGLRIEVIHLPGHSRGHSAFLIEPEGILYVADIDLTTFGPYYGDHWSDLEDFERSLDRVQEIEARWYVTFHHKGVVEGQAEFVKQVQAFRSVISKREERLLEFLAQPRTLDDIVTHRFVYRPGDDVLWADTVERRSMRMHLDRLARTQRVINDGSTWVAR